MEEPNGFIVQWEQQKALTGRTANACLSYFIGFEGLSKAGRSSSTAETPWSGILGHPAHVQAHSLQMIHWTSYQNLRYYKSNFAGDL